MNKKALYLMAIIIVFGGFLQFWQASLYWMALFCDFLILATFLFALLSFKRNHLKIRFYSIATWILSTVGLFVAPKILSPVTMPDAPVLYEMFFRSVSPYTYAWTLVLTLLVVPGILILSWKTQVYNEPHFRNPYQ